MSDSEKMLINLNSSKDSNNRLRLGCISNVLLKKNFVTHFLYPVYTNVDDDTDVSPQSCPSGSYCPITGSSISIECPAGYYCPAGTINPIQCPSGKTSLAGSAGIDSCMRDEL